MKNLLAIVIGMAVLICNFAFAADQTKAEQATAEKIKLELKRKYPGNTVTSVTKAPMGNLYEVAMGKNVAFVDPDTKYLLFGHIFEMSTQHDVTQDHIDSLNAVDFSTLPLKNAIKVVKGNGSRVFAVFSDPDCPYCHQLENNLSELDNYTMYVFLFPIAQLHPGSRAKAEAIWCAKDRAKAWTDAMLNDKQSEQKDCATPLDQVAELAQSLGVSGTPTMINSDGRIAPGALPTPALETWLSPNAAASKK